MEVKILKDASFALDGKFVVQLKEGEVKEFTDAQCARLIEIGFAELASASDTTTKEPLAEKDPVEVVAAGAAEKTDEADKSQESPKKRGRRSKRG